ncbi:hypothetical protein GWO13_05890 [Candidatus Bathyarchaeota archaeon]|nr:hypothetical protein [Candidatus Bathyarchaeota archaeon]
MAKKGCIHKIEMEYSTDRLTTRKLSQVYQQLLPDRVDEPEFALGETIGEEAHETSSDLRAGIIGATERR